MFQHLSLKRPLVFIDLETTGLRIGIDRIVEFGAVRFEPEKAVSDLTVVINPEIPIPPSATAIHGIHDSHVEDCPTFAESANTILAFLEGADLAGYNLRRFDLPVLADAFRREGIFFPINGRKVVDVRMGECRSAGRNARPLSRLAARYGRTPRGVHQRRHRGMVHSR